MYDNNKIMKEPKTLDYGFYEYEIPMIIEAHEKMNDLSGFEYSEEVLIGRAKEKRKERTKSVLAWLLFLITVYLGLIIFINILPHEFPKELAVYFYMSSILLGMMILVIFFDIAIPIVSFWKSFLDIFIPDDSTIKEMEQKEEDAYREKLRKIYFKFDIKYGSFIQYKNDMKKYKEAIYKKEGQDGNRKEIV